VSRTVVIRVGTAEQVRRELQQHWGALQRGERTHQPREIWFSSIAQLATVLTEKRLELLRLIRRRRPRSVSHLASLAQRAVKAVERDVQALERAALVRLVGSGKTRRPVASCDRIHLAGDIDIARAAA